MQDNRFSCLVFVGVEKQKFGDANFSEGEMILIGQFFCCWITGLENNAVPVREISLIFHSYKFTHGHCISSQVLRI